MRETPEHLIIEGNFAPARSGRVLRVTLRLLSLLFGFSIIGALAVYGIKVHYEDTINRVAKETREMNEQNKELQVKLNHIRSYKNVEAAATKVPHLQLPPTVIEVPAATSVKSPAMPALQQEIPRVYGY